MGKAKKVKAPKAEYGQDISKLLSAFQSTLPSTVAFEQQFRPQFQGLNLGDVSAFNKGVGGQAGYNEQLRGSTEEAAAQMNAARQAEIASMTGQAGQARGLFQSISPEAAARVQQSQEAAERAKGLEGLYQGQSQRYVDQANTIGNEAFLRRGYLSPEQNRNAEQQARASAQSAGRVGGNLGIAGEIMNRESALAARRSEASSSGGNAYNQYQNQQNNLGSLRNEAQGANLNAYNLGQQFYTNPGLSLLSAAPQSYQVGRENLEVGLRQIGRGTPALFDAGQALNLGATERANKLAASQANAAASAARTSAIAGAVMKIGAVAAAPFTGGASLALLGVPAGGGAGG